MKVVKFGEVKKLNLIEKGRPNWIELNSYNYVSGYMVQQNDYDIKLFEDYAECKRYIRENLGVDIPDMRKHTEYSNVDEIGDFERVKCNGSYNVQFFGRYNYCLDMGVNLIDIRKDLGHYDVRLELVAFKTFN